MATVRDIITKSMRKAGILSQGEAPQASESTDALDDLNGLLDSVSNHALMNYVSFEVQATLSGGVGYYTIGSGATFNTTKPASIISARVRVGTVDYPLSQVSLADYERFVQVKSTTGIPEIFTYDNASPTGKINLYPIPAAAYVMTMLVQRQGGSLGLDDTVQFPAGWVDFMVYELARRLSSEYGLTASEDIKTLARESRAAIELQVAKNTPIDWNAPQTNGFNVYSGF